MKKAITIACILLIAISMIILVSCGKDKDKDNVQRTTVPRTTLADEDETTEEFEVVTDGNGTPVTDSSGEVVTRVPETKPPVTDKDGQVVTEKPAPSNPGGTNNPTNPTSKTPDSTADKGPQQIQDAMKILQSGKFYLKGTSFDGKETTPMRVAISGEDLYMYTKMEGIEIAILILSGDTYLINPSKNAYWKPSKLILKQMGFDEFETPNFGETTDKSEYIGAEEATVGGKKLTCHKYRGEDGTTKWYMDSSGKVVSLETFDPSSTLISRIEFEELSGKIPDGLIENPANKYKKSSINIFMP